MTGPVYTPSMLASALNHLDRSHGWVRGTCNRTGRQFVQFTSSRKLRGGQQRVYRCDENVCNCPGYSYHHGMCAHILAVKMAAERERARARRPRRSMAVTAP